MLATPTRRTLTVALFCALIRFPLAPAFEEEGVSAKSKRRAAPTYHAVDLPNPGFCRARRFRGEWEERETIPREVLWPLVIPSPS